MKRSEINKALMWATKLLESHQIKLPPFGYWTMNDWQKNAAKISTIKHVMLGWDITDYGMNQFDQLGAVLFTLRNGDLQDSSIGTPYAEKLIILKDGQRLPNHYHASKTEDIINRGGGVLAIKLFNSTSDGKVDEHSEVKVEMDGIWYTVKAGETIYIKPGHSITLRPYMFHLFWAKAGEGDLICGEVSSINDDNTDNYNADVDARFSEIIEDEPVLHPLCNEYEKLLEG